MRKTIYIRFSIEINEMRYFYFLWDAQKKIKKMLELDG